MKDYYQELEYWYDIYVLSEKREVASIESFLSHFADRNQIEFRKAEVITLIPDVSLPEKHRLFKDQYVPPHLMPSPGRLLRRFNFGKVTKLEKVSVNTLREAIELGILQKDRSFSIYLRYHIRKDVKCLVVHFTGDSKVILGVSIAEENELGQNN